MLVANRIKDKYELGDNIVIPINKEEYEELKNICRERSYIDNHGFIIISKDSGFTDEQLEYWNNRIKEYLNPNKIKIE